MKTTFFSIPCHFKLPLVLSAILFYRNNEEQNFRPVSVFFSTVNTYTG